MVVETGSKGQVFWGRAYLYKFKQLAAEPARHSLLPLSAALRSHAMLCQRKTIDGLLKRG